MDSGDKATNKVMSIAYKYATFQAFCIPTKETAIDADAEVHEVASHAPDDILKAFTEQAMTVKSVNELKGKFGKIWTPLNGTVHQAEAKNIYDICKAELEAVTCQ